MGEYVMRLAAALGVLMILVASLVLTGGALEHADNEDEFLAVTTVESLEAHSNVVMSETSQPPGHDHHAATTATAALMSTILGNSTTAFPATDSSTTIGTLGTTTTSGTITTQSTGIPAAANDTSTTSAGGTIASEMSLTNPVVNAGTRLVFDSAQDTTLHVHGNMTVLGELVMHPNPDVTHRIVFEDRGELLVTGSGVLDIEGTRRVAWNRTGTDPTWRAGDELIVAPIAPNDWEYHPFTLGSAVPTFQGYAAEVANLTRNVVIDGPSRVMFMGLDGHAPQMIKYATIANAGVTDQLGMYSLHFHLNGDATRGSIVEGVLVRDSQFRAFVPHGSNGITFRDTLAVNVIANGYWWDLNRASEPPDPIHESNDIIYERAGVIGLTISSPPDQGRQSGFNLGDGSGNVVRDSFVAGLRSGKNHSGFQWPEAAQSVWTAQNLVSHNNKGHGFFVWQNDAGPHVITGIDSYLNGGSGISQGAYVNSYQWVDARLVANGVGVRLTTVSRRPPSPRQTFECVTITDSPVGVLVGDSPVDGIPTLFSHLVMQRVEEEFHVTDDALALGQTLATRVELVAYQTLC